LFDRFPRQRVVIIQSLDRRFHQLTPTFATHDQRGFDLAKLDHVGRLRNAVHAVAGSRKSRHTEPWIKQPTRLAGNEAAANALLQLITLSSLGRVPGAQKRRSRIPVINSRRPAGSLNRSYSGPSFASTSSLVQISCGRVYPKDSTQTRVYFMGNS
jgi:hypothetical protein